MTKKILTVLLFLTLILTGMTVLKSQGTQTLIINYYRFDDDYSVFNSVWLWPSEPEEGAGDRFFFDEEGDFGQRLELDLEGTILEGSTEIGLIVRGDDWQKDVDEDLFVDLSDPDGDGVVEIFLVENDPTVYYSEEEADTSHRIQFATFTDFTTIRFRATRPTEIDDLEVLANGETVAIEDYDPDGYGGVITLAHTIDLSKVHTMRADLGEDEPAERAIGLSGIYDSEEFHDTFGYDGDLGALYSESETEFKLWAPLADSVELNLYEYGHTADVTDYEGIAGVDDPYDTVTLELVGQGVWSVTMTGDLDGTYYTFTVDNGDLGGIHEVTDPYAFSAGVNGQRSMVVNFERQNPDDWQYGRSPHTIGSYNEAIIYELHVRDLTSHEGWQGNEDYRGKFLGLSEPGTEYQGVTTGFDHIKELGVTHVHLLPVMDFGMVDETRLLDEDYHGIHDGIFNWGYMPRHFNVLEGSYSTDPFNGEVRIHEFKRMVNDYHDAGIGIIMDVVYNHTGQSADSNFHRIVPGYYHRLHDDGTFSDGSGTGNETASEREMFSKFMVDSLTFFVEEYNIDGFRFDLMQLHDVTTMNAIADELHAIDENIILYGEPWTGGPSLLPEEISAHKHTLEEMPAIAAFNDDARDAIAQGTVFDSYARGFVQGIDGRDNEVLLGITGGTEQPGLLTGNLPDGAWAPEPYQAVNYVSAHDNHTLHDKLVLSTEADMDSADDMETIIRMQRQANNVVLTSQGIAFLHAGVEFLRTKPCIEPEAGEYTCDDDGIFDHNSYRSPDETNQLDWDRKVEFYDTFAYHRNLIAMRRAKQVFSQPDSQSLGGAIRIMHQVDGMVAYALLDETDDWATILVVHNNGSQSRNFEIPHGEWHVVATTDEIGERDDAHVLSTLFTLDGETTLEMDPNDSYIMYSETLVDPFEDPVDENGIPWGLIGGLIALLALGIPLGFYYFKKT